MKNMSLFFSLLLAISPLLGHHHHHHDVDVVVVQQPVMVAQPVVVAQPILVEQAPPTDIFEMQTSSPGENYVWTKGYWQWNGGWNWVGGQWIMRPTATAVWVPGYWHSHHHHYEWVPGRWN